MLYADFPVAMQIVLPLTREWIEISAVGGGARSGGVLPLTREWIEMSSRLGSFHRNSVLPLTREWIEISPRISRSHSERFSLLRGSGLK